MARRQVYHTDEDGLVVVRFHLSEHFIDTRVVIGALTKIE